MRGCRGTLWLQPPRAQASPPPSAGVHWCLCGPHRRRDLHLQLAAQGALCWPGGPGPHLRLNGEWQQAGAGTNTQGIPGDLSQMRQPRQDLPQATLGLMPEGPCGQEAWAQAPGGWQVRSHIYCNPPRASQRGPLNSQPVGSRGPQPHLSCKESILVARDRIVWSPWSLTVTSSLRTGLQLPQLDGEEPGGHGDPAGGRETHPRAPENRGGELRGAVG